MEIIFLFSILPPLLILLLALKFLLQLTKPSNLPPSPPSLPIIGHLHHLNHPLIHRTLLQLSHKYGPVMSLRFGSRLVVVVSSWTAAEECFTTNDVVLANRPGSVLSKHINYNAMSVMAAPYGDHWRRMRRVSAHQIFSTQSLDAFAEVRKEEIERLIKRLARGSMEGFVAVELRTVFDELPFRILMRVLVGKTAHGEDPADDEVAKQFQEIISDIIKISKVTYPGKYY